ncbi:hypothetical protein [Streptomyces sp. DH41]|uniref:hypothetical protein n=1 Tax=Streptomyces sp. DH41 TaxID=3040125 RepID=UPI003014D34E
MRSSRRAQAIMTTATPNTTPAADSESVAAMMIAENRTNEASSSTSAATPTRHGPGR